MNIEEYKKIENLNYDEYCNYLQNKYGKSDCFYLTETWKRNPKCSRTKEGLYAHHKMENSAPNLSEPAIAKSFPYEYQSPDNIVYCDLLEHLLLHILISETPNIDPRLGYNGALYIVNELNDIYFSDNEQPAWKTQCVDNVCDDEDVFKLLVERLENRSVLLEHNVTVFKELEDYLEHSNKALVIIGTGGGKTTTALEYLRINNIRGLVLCPTNIIKDSWAENKNVDAETYSYFRENYEHIDYSKYGAVIIDEAHHCSTDNVLGKSVQWAIDHFPELKFIGLTAEEKRTDGMQVANILFDGNVAQGVNIIEGIETGIFHPFTYVGAYYDTTDIRKKYSGASKELDKELDLVLNNTPTLKDIFLKEMPKDKRKAIIFVSDIEAIDEALRIMKDIYPNAEYKIIHSKQNKKENEKNKEWFKNTDEGFLVSINMISEGAHYPGVNTLIMFRRTESHLVFNQQLGRIITLSKFKDPNGIVFDLVNNAFNAGYEDFGFRRKKDLTDEQRKLLRAIFAGKSDKIIVKSYTNDIDKILHEIDDYNDVHWSPEEDEILRKYYPTGGLKECKKYLNRTKEAIKRRAQTLGIKYDDPNKRSPEEDDILRKYYPNGGIKKCAEYLIKRTKKAIGARAKKLKIKSSNRYWSEDEINLLKKYYPIGGSDECAKYISNKTVVAIYAKASQLKIKSSNRYWSEDEDSIIKKYYPDGGYKACAEYLIKRKKTTILTRAKLLGIKSNSQSDERSPKEDDIIRKYYPSSGWEGCEKYLIKRNKEAIKKRAQFLKIKYVHPRIWTKQEDDILRKYYPDGGIKKCAEYLPQRSNKSIKSRSQELQIKLNNFHWSQEEDEIIRKYYPNGGWKGCEKYLINKTEKAIQRRAYRLGVKRIFNE